MRETKFRGLGVDGKWWYGESSKPSGENHVNLASFFANAHVGAIRPETIVEYTGLHDKNGKEIYESDYMQTNKNILFAIIWSPKSARWSGITPNIWTDKPYVGNYIYKSLSYLSEHGEVIGNIWENGELLNDSK